MEAQADGKSSINSHKLNIFESKEAPRSSRQDAENPFHPSFLQESFALTDNIFEDRGSVDKISLNIFKDTMRQFSNSFVLNSFNQSFKPVLADARASSRSQFGLIQSRSLHKIDQTSAVEALPMPLIRTNLPVTAPIEPVKFFDLPGKVVPGEASEPGTLGGTPSTVTGRSAEQRPPKGSRQEKQKDLQKTEQEQLDQDVVVFGFSLHQAEDPVRGVGNPDHLRPEPDAARLEGSPNSSGRPSGTL